MRWLPLLLAVFLTAPSQAASLRDIRLEETLQKVAEESSEGTPRTINANITDMGFEAQGDELINRLSVEPAYAERMQEDPLLIRSQLQASVCTDLRFRRLLDMGATLTYHFMIKDSDQPVLTQSFIAEHCQTL
ncbi:PA3611 family quorum-sensing-regulated virulence factor [Halopseudomonas sabulinigri]|uniref:Putative quorum-sensing-regulated virulence factor n=1 Tax=Halopseudomonas sabulinigri TaxID=472181 RepID=A0A1H1XBY2_9GAMM|nr:PA3611 family quorum-sensing-regulated virulence factor [Halopseudomonas sabulinigri]SDT06824.1 Putative quorum-sensing-regulated virulence factor [Halopseudomonas sabulinigri]